MARTPIVTATYKTFPIKKILLIMFALLPTVAIAADKSITVSFDYSGNASAYRLYMDGNQVCESQAGAEKNNAVCMPFNPVRGPSFHYDCNRWWGGDKP